MSIQSSYIQSSSTLRFPRGPAARIRAAFAALPPKLELGAETLAALPSKPSGPHSARVAQPASSQERVHPRHAGMKSQNLSHASEYISPTA
jgi:hypothetical protein